MVKEHYRKVLFGRSPEQLLLQFDGEGGTGKTTVVMALCAELDRLAPGKSPYVRVAPIGVAAHNIGGRTLHSVFRLPVKKSEYKSLPTESPQSLQSQFRYIH